MSLLNLLRKKTRCPLTCDQVLVLVDIKLDAAQTLWSIRVYVLHMMDLFEPFVHLKDIETKFRSKEDLLNFKYINSTFAGEGKTVFA